MERCLVSEKCSTILTRLWVDCRFFVRAFWVVLCGVFKQKFYAMYCAICKIGFNVNKELFTFGVLVDKFRPSSIHRSAMSPRTITIGSQNCCLIYKNSLAVPPSHFDQKWVIRLGPSFICRAWATRQSLLCSSLCFIAKIVLNWCPKGLSRYASLNPLDWLAIPIVVRLIVLFTLMTLVNAAWSS